ncbi:PAS domain S-box-containing protein [Desulfobaculum xiamenense]|uniref:histidine kinase n=1 Tax=Desulfobaculum xiamenense TaxID=995050 RepID=A0A846QP75_9BACT|nr:cache domain-containing protein [Desulfobaculum xiamenense]NJB67014.1 PAS domain S-box-containing protein [Desulfobaculum xiamenense]
MNMGICIKKSLTNDIKRRMLALAVISATLTAALWIHSEYRSFSDEIGQLRSVYLDSRKEKLREELGNVLDYIGYMKSTTDERLRESIRSRVYEAHAIATHIVDTFGADTPRERLESLVREALRPISFNNGRGYFFAGDFSGVEQLFPPNQKYEQRYLLDLRDTEGRLVIRDVIDICRTNGEGFYEYHWPKPGIPDSSFPKIAYVKTFAPFGWFIGTGEYLDDVERDIKAEVLSRLGHIRFEKSGYIFVVHRDGTMLANGLQPELVGQPVPDNTAPGSPSLMQLGQEAAAQPGGGFMTYMWRKPGSDEQHPKMSHIRPVDEWDWMVGAGVYLDEIDQTIGQMRSSLISDIRDRLLRIGALLALLIVGISLSTRLMTAQINRSFTAFSSFFDKAAKGAAHIDPGALEFDEFAALAEPANRMIRERDMAQEKLQQARDTLEIHVREKTAELVTANDTLRRREELLRVTFNSTGDAILVLDQTGNIVDTNPQFATMWGIPERMGLDDSASVFALMAEQVQAPDTLREGFALLAPDSVRFDELACRDGRTIERYAYPLVRDGHVMGRVFNFRDITERVNSQREVQSLRSLLGNIVDSMPSILIAVDRLGRVTQWNRAAAERTGISATKAQRRPLEEVFHILGDDCQAVHKAMRDAEPQFATRIPRLVEGEKRFFDLTVYPLGAQTVEGAVMRLDDVTSRVHIEDMMIQTEKMMSVGGLAAGMAHEINNPLGAVLQASQNITRRLSPDMPANKTVADELGLDLTLVHEYMQRRKISTYIEGIQEAGNRAAVIVRNMLDFSRKSETTRTPHNIGMLLDRAAELASKDYDLKKKYDFKQIEIVREYDPDTPIIAVNGTELEQVFLNLLKNAGQAMAEKDYAGQTPRITLRTAPENGKVRIEIEDNGPGIRLESHKRIFEPFFTTKGVGFGTGLGLSVSYFIITRNHGGEFRVDSEPGEWTRFTIHLPPLKPHHDETQPDASDSTPEPYNGTKKGES